MTIMLPQKSKFVSKLNFLTWSVVWSDGHLLLLIKIFNPSKISTQHSALLVLAEVEMGTFSLLKP